MHSACVHVSNIIMQYYYAIFMHSACVHVHVHAHACVCTTRLYMSLAYLSVIKRAHIQPAGCSRRESRITGASPFFFTISVLGSFTCITQHTAPTTLRPIRRTKQLRFSVLLKDTSATTGQARIRTHILTTPELESNALDRTATTLHMQLYMSTGPVASLKLRL